MQVKHSIGVGLLLLVLAGGGQAQEPAAASADPGPLRLSALVSAGTRFYAGFVEVESGHAFLVPEGGKVLNWRVVSIDETAMSARLVDAEGAELLLVLQGDERAAALAVPDGTNPGIKTLEEFLAEHPDLAASLPESAPMDFPGPTNAPVTFEDFMAAHPEMAGLSNYVAPELRNPAGGPTPTLSEAQATQVPVTREEGLRRMAEQAGQPVPDNAVTTFEDFLRQHAPSGAMIRTP